MYLALQDVVVVNKVLFLVCFSSFLKRAAGNFIKLLITKYVRTSFRISDMSLSFYKSVL